MVRSTEHLLLTRSATWRDSTPREFTFAWKASKFITHWKRLSAKCENSIALMETRLEALGPKGCLVLFQLPPNFPRINLDWPHSFRCCQTRDAMPSNFDIEVGIRMESWSSCKAVTQRSAFPTMRMHLHLGRRQQAMFTCVDMALGALSGQLQR